MDATILTYLGTLLIASDIVANFGHVLSFTSFTIFKHMFDKYREKKIDILVILMVLPAFLFAILILVVETVVRIPTTIDRLLNYFYKKLKEPFKAETVAGVKKLSPNAKKDQINKSLDQMRIPFMALFGIIILTIGFVIDMKNIP
jgi:hypothetical protein